MLLTTLLALPFAGSLAAVLLPTRARNSGALLAGLIALVCTGLTIHAMPGFAQAAQGAVLRESYDWIPSAGLSFKLRMDGLSWLFCLLIYGIGAMVALYARYYLSPQDPVPRFYAFMLAFMGSMAGVVMAGHLVVLAFFWELTSLFSFLLIGYWYHRRDARCGARNALLVTGLGGLCLLAGLLLMGHIVGSYDMDAVLAAGGKLRAHPLYLPMLVLVLLGALSKSAQFPFHFWLPQAMAAPTPVSAYLHSATLVKAGVFLLARFWPVLAGTDAWFWMVGGAGLVTLLVGAWAALFQNDLKGLLAYSTISHLGLITLLLGLNSDTAALAAVFHIMNHATFKASLFMAAGIIDHETGTRDIRKLSGLWRSMPVTAALAIVASGGMAGVPLLNGFLSKEMFFAETTFVTSAAWVEWMLPVAATLGGALAVAYSLRFVRDVFFGPADALRSPRKPHEPVRWMRLPVELLVLACLVVGIAPEWSVGRILDIAAQPLFSGVLPTYSLELWHGFNLPLLMSLLAFAGGTALYLVHPWLVRSDDARWVPLMGRLDGAHVFHLLLVGLARAARGSRLLLDTHRLQPQLRWLLGAALLGGGAAVSTYLPVGPTRDTLPVDPAFAALWVIGGICAIGTAWAARRRRLAALTLSGGTGLCCCLTFVWCSAPDLALTQLTVEIATTVLLLLALRWLPRPPARPIAMNAGRQVRRLRDLLLALGIGGGLAALAWWTMTRPLQHSVSDFYLRNSKSEAGGANVVNVMLVDFRGFDTFGEAVVLSIVALTVYALLRRFRPARSALALPMQQRDLPGAPTDLVNPRHVHDTAVGYLTIPAVLVRLMLPLAATVSAWLFLRGHNAPGGGFVAALVLSIALLLQYLVSGTQWVDARVGLRPRRWIAAGMLTLLAAGAGAWIWGYPFLTSHTVHLPWPGADGTHLPSAFFFDLGVFVLVVGTTLLMLTSVAHQSVRAHRASARGADEHQARRHAEAAQSAAQAGNNGLAGDAV